MSFHIRHASAGAPLSGSVARLSSNGRQSNRARRVTAAQRAWGRRRGTSAPRQGRGAADGLDRWG